MIEDCPTYKRVVKALGRRTRHVTTRFEGKFISYEGGFFCLAKPD
ncbi:MAG: hypothetical protein ACUVQM_02665 [Candidatus Hadarchaeaceae archaeon]